MHLSGTLGASPLDLESDATVLSAGQGREQRKCCKPSLSTGTIVCFGGILEVDVITNQTRLVCRSRLDMDKLVELGVDLPSSYRYMTSL